MQMFQHRPDNESTLKLELLLVQFEKTNPSAPGF